MFDVISFMILIIPASGEIHLTRGLQLLELQASDHFTDLQTSPHLLTNDKQNGSDFSVYILKLKI